MDLAPLGKVLNEDSNTGSKEEKVKSSSKKRDSSPHQAR